MASNHLFAFLILCLIQIAGLRTGILLVRYKDTLWYSHLRNAKINPRQYAKPAIWDPMLTFVGIFLVVGNLLLFIVAVQVFWA